MGLLGLIAVFSRKQLPPTIKYGEFPFHLIYEFNGEIYDIEDVVVCEFDGFDISGGFGERRTWDEYLKSGKDRISIFVDKNVPSVLNPERINTRAEVYIDFGTGEYYMGDPNGKSGTHGKPNIFYVERYDISDKITMNDATNLTEKQVEEFFGIKIIKWDFSEPMKNEFK